MDKKPVHIIGRAEAVDFPKLGLEKIPAKIDTGAKTSAIWCSNIHLDSSGQLVFYLFGEGSPFYSGNPVTTKNFSETIVTSSIGARQRRYVVRLSVRLDGRLIRASFTLADRSKQIYPILIGRNILRGKFVVDVKKGFPLKEKEDQYYDSIKNFIQNGQPRKEES